MRGNKTLIVISAAAALGLLAGVSTALANDSGENNQGGYVVPGSMSGVNPVYHPGLVRAAARAENAYGYAIPDNQRRPTRERDDKR
jgi:hypothetical protein